jgi:CheY-like chemotaxis protein
LSIVSNLAQAMDGEVGVESTPGQGSLFWFKVTVQLPTAATGNAHPQKPAGMAVHGTVQPRQLRGHLLVAEDHPINAKVIQSLLTRMGLRMTLAQDGRQAVDAITLRDSSDPFHLVLMDLQMPELDGYAATQEIRAWEAQNSSPRIPIIALTADAFEEIHQRCLSAGMDGFLTKPVAFAALQNTLAQWLQAEPEHAPPAKVLNQAAVRALTQELSPLLEENKFAALGVFKKLQDLTQNTPLSPSLQALEAPLQELHFALVQRGIQEMLDLPAMQSKPEKS